MTALRGKCTYQCQMPRRNTMIRLVGRDLKLTAKGSDLERHLQANALLPNSRRGVTTVKAAKHGDRLRKSAIEKLRRALGELLG